MNKFRIFIVVVLLVIIFVVGINLVPMFTLSNTANETVKIGLIIPLTGLDARQGDLIKKGVLLAQDELKNLDNDVEFYFEDSKGSSVDALNAYSYLKGKDVDVIYTLGSPVSIALSKEVLIDKKLLFAVAASPSYKTDGNYIFRVQLSSIDEGLALSELAYLDLNVKNIAIIYVNNDYGKGVEKFFAEPYIDLGGKVIFEESFNQEDKDFRLILSKAKESNPDAIYIGALGVQVAEIAKQAKELGIDNIKFICGQARQNPDLLDVGGNSVEGFIYGSVNLSKESEFYKNYISKYNEKPAQISEEYYKLTKLYTKVYDVCKRDKNCIQNKLKDNNFTKNEGLMFYQNGEIIDDFVLYVVKNGKFVLLK